MSQHDFIIDVAIARCASPFAADNSYPTRDIAAKTFFACRVLQGEFRQMWEHNKTVT
jgi:hypothetical protein